MSAELKPRVMRDPLIEGIIERMAVDESVFFVTADFGSPALDNLIARFPGRFINVGIAEQNLINVSAGLALEGFTVFAYAISPFITMRCYEQVRVNLSLMSHRKPLNVNLVGVGAGFSYAVSGPTHQSMEDIIIMRALPMVEVISPSDWVSARAFLPFCFERKTPKYLRLDGKPLSVLYNSFEAVDTAKGFNALKKGRDICLVSTGFMTHKAMDIAAALEKDGVHAGVIDMLRLKYPDSDALASVLAGYKNILTMEEGFTGAGGLDSLVRDVVMKKGVSARVDSAGLDDKYSFHLGDRESLHRQYGAGKELIIEKIKGALK
jgi:transketolase